MKLLPYCIVTALLVGTSPLWAQAPLGSALNFDGNDDYIDCGNSPSLQIEGPSITLEAWINVSSFRSAPWAGSVIVKDESDSFAFDSGYLLRVGGNGVVNFNIGNDGWNEVDTPEGTVTEGQWYHIAGTSDGSMLRIYVNGVEIVSGAAPATVGNAVGQPLFIGEAPAFRGRYYAGYIDEVRVWNVTRTPAELQGAMNRELTETEVAADSGLVGYWDFNDGYGGTVADKSAFDNEGIFGAELGPDASDPEWAFSPFATTPQPADGAVVSQVVSLQWKPGLDATLHKVYISDSADALTDGSVEAIETPNNSLVVGLPGTPIPELIPGTTYYWMVVEVSAVHPDGPGQPAIWSFTVPPRTAWNPSPADQEKYVSADSSLTWSKGLGAIIHTAYFGETFEEVNEATSGSISANPVYMPQTLEKLKTYYWRVDETDSLFNVHRGSVWSFTVAGDSVAIDDFEDYNDVEGFQVYWTWADGYGGLPELGGSTSGYLTIPTMEKRVANSGEQSLALQYDNDGDFTDFDGNASQPTESKILREFDSPANWAMLNGQPLRTLVLFHNSASSGDLFVEVQDSSGQTATIDAQDVLGGDTWIQLEISLSQLADQGINLAQVKSLALGVRAGAVPDNGIVLIDDIRLYTGN